jgi:hypothetical protein
MYYKNSKSSCERYRNGLNRRGRSSAAQADRKFATEGTRNRRHNADVARLEYLLRTGRNVLRRMCDLTELAISSVLQALVGMEGRAYSESEIDEEEDQS